MLGKEVMPMITPRAFIVSNLGKTVISIISADYCDYETHEKNNACGLKCGECKTEAILNAFREASWIPPGVLAAKEREFNAELSQLRLDYADRLRRVIKAEWEKEADWLENWVSCSGYGSQSMEAHIAELRKEAGGKVK